MSCATEKMAMRSSPELVGGLMPAILRSDEAKLKRHSDDQKLMLETGSYYVMYANAFVQGPASILPPREYEKRDAKYKQAKKLYLRGVEILRAAFEEKFSGINEADLAHLQTEYLPQLTKDDVPLIYWLTAGTLSAYSLDPFDLSLNTKIAELSALIKKAYELDPDFNAGALDEFFMLFYASLPVDLGGDKSLVPVFYKRALEKSHGLSAGTYLSWAEVVSIPAQDYPDFKEHIQAALAVDVKKNPDNKLVNILAQRKARYYLKNANLFFIDTDDETEEESPHDADNDQ
jgi:hypothetical protein